MKCPLCNETNISEIQNCRRADCAIVECVDGGPPKIIQIEPVANGLVALTDAGEAFFGYWLQSRADGLAVPTFSWRKLPAIPANPLEYELQPELSKSEIAKRIAVADQLAAQNKAP